MQSYRERFFLNGGKNFPFWNVADSDLNKFIHEDRSTTCFLFYIFQFILFISILFPLHFNLISNQKINYYKYLEFRFEKNWWKRTSLVTLSSIPGFKWPIWSFDGILDVAKSVCWGLLKSCSVRILWTALMVPA